MRAIREILRQRWVQGQPHRAVALSTGRSVGAVYETLRRAREAGLDWAGIDGMTDDALEAALYRRPAVAGPRGTRPQPDCVYLHTERRKPGVTPDPVPLRTRRPPHLRRARRALRHDDPPRAARKAPRQGDRGGRGPSRGTVDRGAAAARDLLHAHGAQRADRRTPRGAQRQADAPLRRRQPPGSLRAPRAPAPRSAAG